MIWVESISSSHSASSQLSGEFMLLHSIHAFANLALKETVPPQSRTSPHVTVKNIYSIQWIQGKRKLLKNPECKTYIEYSEKFQGELCFSGLAQSCSKILNGKKYIQYSEHFAEKLCFWKQAKLLKNP